MSLRDDLKRQALALSQRAVERIMSNDERAARVARAIGAVQRGKRAVDQRQEELMHALSLASKADFKRVGKQLSALKRRLRELDEKLSGR